MYNYVSLYVSIFCNHMSCTPLSVHLPHHTHNNFISWFIRNYFDFLLLVFSLTASRIFGCHYIYFKLLDQLRKSLCGLTSATYFVFVWFFHLLCRFFLPEFFRYCLHITAFFVTDCRRWSKEWIPGIALTPSCMLSSEANFFSEIKCVNTQISVNQKDPCSDQCDLYVS